MLVTAALRLTRTFRAMGTEVELRAVGLAEADLDLAAAYAFQFAEDWEERFSRFRATSELSRLNARAGTDVPVSSDFMLVLEAALEGYARSGGRFDPSLLHTMTRIGYDRDFADIKAGADRGDPQAPALPGPNPMDIQIDPSRRTVRLPNGLGLDFGGLAKGMFVDRLAERFAAWPGGSINAGGDLRVWGEPPDGDAWIVGLEDPRDPASETCQIMVLGPQAQAIATSAMNRRAWFTGGQRYHHLIDPGSGQPVAGTITSATAFGPDLRTAEIATKALIVSAGRGESLCLADASAAVLIEDSGTALFVPGRYPDACAVVAIDSQANPA